MDIQNKERFRQLHKENFKEAFNEGLVEGLEKIAVQQQVYDLDAEGYRLPASAQPCSMSELVMLAELEVERARGYLEGARRMIAVKAKAFACFKEGGAE